MNKKVLLDGCSFTYGLNLERTETLEHHFIENGYEILNLSRPGKSNTAIALDVYNQLDSCDLLVVGWTFSSRWYLKYQDLDIDLLATRENIELPHDLNSGLIEQSYQDLHKSLYSMFDISYWNQLSDMTIDTISAFAQQQNKKFVFFSWEHRNTKSQLYYPHVLRTHRLPCGHLNADATCDLFNKLNFLIEKNE
jgi:hypothetical protein